jgi:hypothetical protein
MALGEKVSTRVSYKQYASGDITANTLATSSSDLGASGGQQLRWTNFSLNLKKDTYEAQEVRTDRQRSDFRHGSARVEGSIDGELSPGTWFDFIEAMCRGTKASAVAKSNTELTSVAASASALTFTFGGGDPVSEGFRVGMIVRFTNTSVSANNSKNFLITGFSGGSNRTMSVYPAPTDMGADTSFNITSVGKRVYPPSSSHVSRKFGVEAYQTDLGIMQLFTECRVGGVNMSIPATGISTIQVPMLGRYMETGDADDTPATAPFFSSPTAATTTGLLTSVNGLIRVGGSNVGVITSAQCNFNLNAQTKPVVGQNFPPEIWLDKLMASGQFTAILQDETFINYFKNESEIEVLLYLLSSTDDASDGMTIHMPRVKLGDAEVQRSGDLDVAINCPFTALKYEGAAAGYDQTTVAFCDTAAS